MYLKWQALSFIGVLFFATPVFANILECDQQFESLQGGSSREGMVPETDPTEAIVLGQTDYHLPRMKVNAEILAALPEDTSAIILTTSGNPYQADFGREFESGRFQLWVDPSANQASPRDFSSWVRDFFPEIVRNGMGEYSLVSFKYYYPAADQQYSLFAKYLDLPIAKVALNLEGGNLMVDGKGHLFLSTAAIARNPDYSTSQIENILRKQLKAQEIHWVSPLPGEPTGHIDMTMKYVGDERMIVSASRDPEQQRVLNAISHQLQDLGYTVYRSQNGGEDTHSTRSYTNSLIVNNHVLVPYYENREYNDSPQERENNRVLRRDDETAQDLYRDLGFCVRPIPGASMIYFQGSVHCMTKQIPRLPGLRIQRSDGLTETESIFSNSLLQELKSDKGGMLH